MVNYFFIYTGGIHRFALYYDEELKQFVYAYCEYDEELGETNLYIPSDWYYVTKYKFYASTFNKKPPLG